MKQADIFKLADMIEEIKALDAMIHLHSSGNKDSIMLSQYKSKKMMLVNNVIDELASENETSGRTLKLIKTIINKFFPDLGDITSDSSKRGNSSGFQVLEKALA